MSDTDEPCTLGHSIAKVLNFPWSEWPLANEGGTYETNRKLGERPSEIAEDFNALMAAAEKLTTKFGKYHSFSLMTHDSTGAEPGLWWAAFWHGNPGPGRIMYEAYADDAALALGRCIHAVSESSD